MGECFEKMVKVIADRERLCDVCIYQSEGCDGGVRGGPYGPIYPPCADTDECDFVDEGLLRRVYTEIMEEKECDHG